jgi:hypothetical protein
MGIMVDVFCRVVNLRCRCNIRSLASCLKLEHNARGYNWATLFLGEMNRGTWPSRLGGSQKYRQYNRLMIPVGIRSKKG